MGKRILVPVDGSPGSEKALEFAFAEHQDAEIVVIHVINPIDAGYASDMTGMDYWEGWYDNAQDRADSIFESATAIANEYGREISTVKEIGSPSRSIVGFVESEDIDQIVMGSHGRSGVQRILLGSVAETVVRRSPVPVTVIR